MTWPATLSLILPLSLPESNAWALTCWEKRNLDFFFFFWTHPAHSLCLLARVFREKNALETGPKKIKTRKLIRRTQLCFCCLPVPTISATVKLLVCGKREIYWSQDKHWGIYELEINRKKILSKLRDTSQHQACKQIILKNSANRYNTRWKRSG